jgi:hypothetical protein
MILQHYTWQQFLVAALILSLIWYVALVLALYREQLVDFLNGRRRPARTPEPIRHEWDEELEEGPFAEESLMGKSAHPEGMSRVSMSDFGFAPVVKEQKQPAPEILKNDEAMETVESRETKIGLVPDVLEELKSIFQILQRDKGGKAEFISLFGLVSAKYAKIRGTANEQAINAYIRENVLFPISDKELDGLWI